MRVGTAVECGLGRVVVLLALPELVAVVDVGEVGRGHLRHAVVEVGDAEVVSVEGLGRDESGKGQVAVARLTERVRLGDGEALPDERGGGHGGQRSAERVADDDELRVWVSQQLSADGRGDVVVEGQVGILETLVDLFFFNVSSASV